MKQKHPGSYLFPLLITALICLGVGISSRAIADDISGSGTNPNAPSVEFSTDGSTLVIKASGDITDYTSPVSIPGNSTFTNAAATKITTQQNSSSFVKAGDGYQTTTPYYEANVKYTQVVSSDVSKYISGPNYKWRSDVKTTLGETSMYSVTYADGVWKAISKESDFNWINPNNFVYIVVDGKSYVPYVLTTKTLNYGDKITPSYDGTGDVQAITKEDFFSKYASCYYNVQYGNPATYKSADKSTEGSTTISVDGKDVTVVPLEPGTTITFDADNDKLYTVDAENSSYIKIENNDNYFFTEHPEYIHTDYTTSTLSFIDQVKAKLAEGKYSSVRFEKAEGGADITISLDQMKDIIAYNGNYKLQGNNSVIDFSAVGKISDLGAAEVPNTVNNVSVVLPDALRDAEAKSIAGAQKNGNWYWLSDDGTILNVEGLYPGRFSSAASVKLSGKTKSIVVMGKVGFDILKQKNLQNLDIAGIDNLDIHYVTTTDGNQFSMNDPFAVFKGFKNLKRVVIPGTDDISTLAEPADYESSVQVFQSLPFAKDYAGKETTDHILQTRVMKENVINNLSHYTPEDFKNAVEFAFIGKLSYDDFSFFSGIEGKKVNLIHVSLKDANKTTFEVLETIKNNNIEYLALPDAKCDTTSTLFPTLHENMPNLKGLGYFNDTTFTAQTWKEPGGICILTAMMQPVLIPGNTSKVKSVRISGPVNAEDLGRESTTVDEKGHLTYKITTRCVQDDKVDPLNKKYIATSTDRADHYVRSHGAFSYANFSTADLSGAEIDENYPNDLCLSLLACYQNCDTIALPSKGKEIPVGCFANFGKLTSICIPESYEYIRSAAFDNLNSLRNISTTSGDSIISLGDNTMVISKNMKLIETGAFSNVEKIVDVYCLGNEAPEAQRWAFNTTMTYGNSGFSPSPAITRKNYVNHEKPISVLHFPTTCTAEQIEKYTDPTREYSITDGQGTTDGNGHYLVWPNQSEFIRAYVQGHTGYTWKAWNTKREPYNNGLVYALNEGMQAHQSQADSLWKKSDSPTGTKFYDSTDKTSDQKDYRGWHEFALVAAYNYEEPDPIYDFGAVRDNNWWTLCLPFDMTKKNLRLVFGDPNGRDDDIKNEDNYPRVCELTGVERNLSTHSIILKFGKDLVMNTSEKDATVPGEDAVIMKAGHPYLIKPKMPDAEREDTWTPSKHILKYSQIGKDFSELLAGYGEDGVGGILRDNIKDVPAFAASQAGSKKEDDTYYYRFIATFASWYIPRYSYFLGWHVDRPAWWWKPTTTATERQWAPNTCIILVTKNSDEAPTFVTSAGNDKGEVAHWNVTSSGFEFCNDDSFADQKASGSKRAGMLFDFVGDPGTTTGISHVVIDTSKADPSSVAPIYNLNGQLVSRTGSTDGLARGIYIKNGKKIIVK